MPKSALILIVAKPDCGTRRRLRLTLGDDLVKHVTNGLGQRAQRDAGVVRKVQVHGATTARGKRDQIARSLRFRKAAQAVGDLVAQRDVLDLVGGQNQEDAVVRTALLQLTGGMQITRANFQAGHDTQLLGHRMTDVLKRLATPFTRVGKERVQREEVAGLDAGEQIAQGAKKVGEAVVDTASNLAEGAGKMAGGFMQGAKNIGRGLSKAIWSFM